MAKMFTNEEKPGFMKSLMCDYNIPPEHCLEALEGKRKNAAHYNDKTLFRKMVESFRWFTILKILPLDRIAHLLTEDVVKSLRFQSLRNRYEFVHEKLQKYLQSNGNSY